MNYPENTFNQMNLFVVIWCVI